MIKYKMDILNIMLQMLRQSLKPVRCVLTGHEIAKVDENELFSNKEGYLETKCARCRYPLLLRIDPADKDEDTYMIMDR
jgi:phage FluMu protein Com